MAYLILEELQIMLEYVGKRKSQVKPAALEAELRSKDWTIIQPITVGNDHSIVVKANIKKTLDVIAEGRQT